MNVKGIVAKCTEGFQLLASMSNDSEKAMCTETKDIDNHC